MPPELIGGAIAAFGGVASAAIGSSGASSAARQSAAASDRAAALQQQQYDQNKATLAPYVQAGLPATQQINALLGLGDGTDWAATVQNDPAKLQDYYTHWSGGPNALGNMTLADYGKFAYGNDIAYKRGDIAGNDGQKFAGADPNYQGMDLSQYSGTNAAARAFDQFRNSTGYDFRVKQGMNALNSGYAGAGTIKSGAAIKGAVDYGQGMASQEFGNYLNALGTQQGVGLSAAGAQAGVGTNYANSLGSIYMQNGANQANASLVKASAIGGGLAGAANIAGSILAPTYNSGVNMGQFNNLVANNNSYLAGRYGG